MPDPEAAALPDGDHLRRDDDHFRRLVEAVQDYAIIALGADGDIAIWNAGAEHVTGHAARDAVGRPSSIFYPKEEIEAGAPEHHLTTAAAEGRLEDEGWRVRKDGSRFWANSVITALRSEQGALGGFSVVFRDLTDRRRREQALRASEERFRLLVEGVTGYAIFMLDPGGHVTSWNAGAERIKGYRVDEILGRHFSTFYPPDALARGWPEHELQEARNAGRFEDEGWRVRKDGSRFWASVVITAIRDARGELIGFSKITRDLTNRRRQDEALRESEERFRLLVTTVRDYAIFMLDPRGHVASWNAGAERIKGYRAEEIIGQHFSRFYSPEVVAAGWPEHELEVAAREGRFEDEGWRIRKDGSRFWANVVITAVHDSSGALRGFAKVTRDLSERERAQRLETEGRQMNEFLAMLGHELRNPLAPIRNAVALLSARKSADATVAWAHGLIERQVGHLSRLVDDLLDISRITSGKIVLQREVIDLAAVVGAAVEATRPFLEQRRQSVTVEVGPDPLRVDGDATRLSQVVLNLLNNAAKYTPDGGHVWVDLRARDDAAELSVRDDGIGISAELLPRVFDLFIQSERTLDRSEGGLGIGLTMVQRLVALHHGTVAAHSAGPGQGSEFVVRLPLAQAPPAESPGDAGGPPDASSPRPLRVLVVDDNQDAAETTAMLVRAWGHEVAIARDGASALDAVTRQRPRVVLLDIGLPGIDGYEVARRIRAGEGSRRAVLVAMTGYGQAEDRQRSTEAGFTLHLVKPVLPETLQQMLAGVDPE
ncbi:MAG TPA: PAS domain S-box protein [Vicinamibacteria bacterium]|nr:PAS domain S-box protein [Vicinamibacteria bacterium]